MDFIINTSYLTHIVTCKNEVNFVTNNAHTLWFESKILDAYSSNVWANLSSFFILSKNIVAWRVASAFFHGKIMI